jgi:DNA-binding HxlR family transcriptional regulator
MEPADTADSPLAAAVARIGDRWTLLIVDALLAEPRRFGELTDLVAGISPNILSARLRGLEADGVVVSSPYQQRPVRMIYELTAAGRELAGALSLLATWGQQHSDARPAGFHLACGSPMEARLWCPTCERVVDDPEASDDIAI